jgi:hypothetical protein
VDYSLLDLAKSTYQLPRASTNPDISIKNINIALRPYGYRINYWGYCKYYLWNVYQFVPLKDTFITPDKDLVIVYHHADMMLEDWVFTLLERLGDTEETSESGANARTLALSRASFNKKKIGKRIRRKIGRKKRPGRKKIIDNRHIRLDKPKVE